jgi:Na+/melibiose symporter-like transporter
MHCDTEEVHPTIHGRVVWFYPITQQKHADIRAQLDNRTDANGER